MRGAFRIFIDENTRRERREGERGGGTQPISSTPTCLLAGANQHQMDNCLALWCRGLNKDGGARGHGPHRRTVAICSACLNDFQSAVRIQRSQTIRDIFSPGSARSNRLPLSTGGGGAAADGGGEITGGAARRLLYLNSAQKEAPSRLNAH